MSASCDVFIVEDDYDIREVLTFVLEGEGYSVDGAENGSVALEALRCGSRPKLILLDLMMPVMSGPQFAAEKKKEAGLTSIPVVVLSADIDVEQKAATLGAEASLRKPVDVDSLLAMVKSFCCP